MKTPAVVPWLLKAPRALAAGALVVAVFAVAALWGRTGVDPSMVATVERGELVATLTSSGTLRPIQSITYRSPIPGRDVEIRALAPEGTRVNQGDLLVRLGTTELEVELDRVRQEFRQAQMDLQVAEGEWEEAGATVRDVSDGEGAITVEEARTGLQRAVGVLPFALMRRRVCELANQCGKSFCLPAHESQLSERLVVV